MAIRSYQGKTPQIGDRCYIDDSAVITGQVTLGDDSSIWPLVAGRGDVNYIRIGQRTNIQDSAVLHVTRTSAAIPDGYPLIIGDDVTVGHHCTLHGCVVGNRILIGMAAVVMDGAVIEDDVMIGAGSLVTPGTVLTSGYLYLGNPCRQKRPLTTAEIAFLKTSADNYVRLKDQYRQEEHPQLNPAVQPVAP